MLLFGDANGQAVEVVARRLKANLGTAIDRVRLAPRQLYEPYLDTIRGAAVMLDTPHFGGGNTTLEALAMQIPVICGRGEFLRGRFAATRLESLGLDECIANDSADYVQAAVALANSPGRRRAVAERLRERFHATLAPSIAVASFNAALRDLLEPPPGA